ncbi:MAG TPA: trehalose-phosphatase, partial [Burkholderiales bacterium]
MNDRQADMDKTFTPAFAKGWALFLDLDGTLLDIAQQPDAVIVSPQLHETLRAVHQLSNGAMALISGRSLADIDRL